MSMKKSGWRRRDGTSAAATTKSGRARRGEHDVDLAELRRQLSSSAIGSAPKRAASVAAASALRFDDVRDRGAARREASGGELADPARADEQHAPAVEVAEDLLRERGRRGGHRRGALADRGLGADALAELQRLAEHPVEQRARPRRAS